MCDFPTKKLLNLRRDVALKFPPITALAMIAEIDRLRWSHEEKTGCKCWDKALESNPNPVAPEERR